MALTELQKIVLGVVGRHSTPTSGWATGDIAQFVGRQPGRDSNRKHSALVSLTLHELEVLGLVKRLDDETPIAWRKAA